MDESSWGNVSVKWHGALLLRHTGLMQTLRPNYEWRPKYPAMA